MNDGHVEFGDVLNNCLHLFVIVYPLFDLLDHAGGHIDGVCFALNRDGKLVGQVIAPLGGYK